MCYLPRRADSTCSSRSFCCQWPPDWISHPPRPCITADLWQAGEDRHWLDSSECRLPNERIGWCLCGLDDNFFEGRTPSTVSAHDTTRRVWTSHVSVFCESLFARHSGGRVRSGLSSPEDTYTTFSSTSHDHRGVADFLVDMGRESALFRRNDPTRYSTPHIELVGGTGTVRVV